MRISTDKIEEVRAATDILGVVQGYVSLKKRGQNYFGLCPFHSENTPSFSVNPSRGIFRCFGCGKGGNVFGFIMEVERISFAESVRMLAEKAGIALPAVRERDDEQSESEELVRINGLARDFFHQQLTDGKSAGAREAREHLKQRGYGAAVIERYLLGYAPDSWDALAEFARAKGLPTSLLLQAGLLKEHAEKKRVYDAFRHRIIFPIRNLAGRVIAFGGRRLREDEAAKYINSPETAVYRKGRELFGLWEARSEIRSRDEAILVEGYTDCLSLVMAGVPIAVASLGTALTEQQAWLLKRFAARVSILYDGDAAGLSAARRAVDTLLGAGVQPRVIVLPPQDDPDSYVHAHGGEAVWKLHNEAFSPVAFELLLAKRARKPLADAAKELVTSAALIASPVEQDVFLQEIAAQTGVSRDALRREMGQRRSPAANRETPRAREDWPPRGALTALTQVLVRRPEVRAEIFAEWTPAAVTDARLKTVLDTLYEEWQRDDMRAPETLLDRFNESPEREFIAGSLFDPEFEEDEGRALEIDQRMARDCLRAMEADTLRGQIGELKTELAAEPERAGELLPQIQAAMRREKELRAQG